MAATARRWAAVSDSPPLTPVSYDDMEPQPNDQRMNLLGEHVRSVREGAGISQSALARMAGVSRTSIHSLETGTGNPRISTLLAIADAIGVQAHLLVPRLPNGDNFTDPPTS